MSATVPAHDLTVTLVQAPLAWHDAPANHARLRAQLDEAPNTDLIVLPEMFASGFSMAPADCAQAMDGPSVAWMQALARERDAAVGGSLAIDDGGRHVNRFLFVAPDGDIEHYDKRHLFAMAGEERQYAPGSERVVVSYRGWRIVPNVCYDLRFPVWCRHAEGCDLMLFVANWPLPRRDAWNTLLRARAIENQCVVGGVNRVGEDANGKHYFGDSQLIGAAGDLVIACGDQPMTVTATLSADALGEVRRRLPFARDADTFEITGP
jgi:predicted amidohydrolase